MSLTAKNSANSLEVNCVPLSLMSSVGLPNLENTVDRKVVIAMVVMEGVMATSGHFV